MFMGKQMNACFASASIKSRHAITVKISSKVYTSSSVVARIWWAFVDICKWSRTPSDFYHFLNRDMFFKKQINLPVSQLLPLNPGMQLHLNFPARFIQLPPLLQGFDEHSLISVNDHGFQVTSIIISIVICSLK